MITDELLERGLGTLGDEYDVPPRAIDDLVDQLRPAEALAPEDDGLAATSHRWPPTRRTWFVSGAAAALVLIVVAFAAGGGGGNGTRSNDVNEGAANKPAVTSGGTAGRALTAPHAGPGETSTTTGSAAGPVTTAAIPPQAQRSVGAPSTSTAPVDDLTKIVQTGELDLQVDKIKVADAVLALTRYAARAGGMVTDSQTSEGGGDPSASVTLRVPTGTAFTTVLGQARTLGKVLAEETKSANVTSQYVDLSARLRALGLTKATYLRILTKASTIGEILSVQQQINDIQVQIEQLQGQLKVLNDKTTYATLTVSIDQKAKVQPAAVVHHQSGLSKAVDRSVSRFVHGVEAIIGVIGPILLVLLLIGLGWLFVKVGYRIVRRQMV
jgi:hypothetical protein